MSDSRGKPTTAGPTMPCGNGPGRWNKESGSRPSTTTTTIPRRPSGPKAS
ncbi:hypothetical protein [Streptomyces sp. NBC_01237]|nr:hypothetical protein [Streptomyces sp. NBC_01237]WRZ73910.1 hypothetical protein OG251_21010 [Streptomyces sp. NBC_01237]